MRRATFCERDIFKNKFSQNKKNFNPEKYINTKAVQTISRDLSY